MTLERICNVGVFSLQTMSSAVNSSKDLFTVFISALGKKMEAFRAARFKQISEGSIKVMVFTFCPQPFCRRKSA